MKILVTGASGFIGKNIVNYLTGKKYHVIPLQRKKNDNKCSCDLLNPFETKKTLEKIGPVDLIIHTAANAHGEKPLDGFNFQSINTEITKNLLNNLKSLKAQRAIFLSSVSVYGMTGSDVPHNLSINPKPISDYGISKLECEGLFCQDAFVQSHILRLPPVFDHSNLNDIKKRVFIPGTNFKMQIIPSPHYSFLNVSTLAEYIGDLITANESGHWLHHLSDPEVYSQSDITKWFRGTSIPLYKIILKPILSLVHFLPSTVAIKFKENYSKLFLSNIYVTEKIKI